jgi:transposase
MRYELSDYERTAIKPALPNKPRGVRRVNDLLPQTMLLADRGYDADWIRKLARQQGAWANIPPKTNRKKPDLLQSVSVSRAELDRTVLQQDQAMSACRNPI